MYRYITCVPPSYSSLSASLDPSSRSVPSVNNSGEIETGLGASLGLTLLLLPELSLSTSVINGLDVIIRKIDVANS